jgi:benzaldehyde dehydrogenase (NAD)
MEFTRINPLTGEVASSAVAMKASDMPALTAKAASAQSVWAAQGPNARRAVLTKAAAGLESRKDEFEPRRVCRRLFGLSHAAIGRCSIVA